MKYTLLEILAAIHERKPGPLTLKQMKALEFFLSSLSDDQRKTLFWIFRDED